jgi:hypothetical protein
MLQNFMDQQLTKQLGILSNKNRIYWWKKKKEQRKWKTKNKM